MANETTPTVPVVPAPKEVTKTDHVKNMLNQMIADFAKVLPSGIAAEKFCRFAITHIKSSPDLMACSTASIMSETMKAAQDGLLLDGREAALVKFNSNEGSRENPKWVAAAKYMPMVAGILKKVRNSGELASIVANNVYEAEYKSDKFAYWIDEQGEHIRHNPMIVGELGDIVLTYAFARTKSGDLYVEVINSAQMVAIKGASKAAKTGPWAGAFEPEMRKKSAIRRLCKRLPMSTDLEQVVTRDDDLYEFDKPEAKELPEPAKPKTSGLLASVVASQQPTKVIEAKAEPAPAADGEEIPLDEI